MSYLETPDLDGFIAAAKTAKIATVILAWQREWGQVPDQAQVEYGPLRLAWLLAYNADLGQIIRCHCGGEDQAYIRDRLIESGFQVEERSRNLTQFGLT
jgi:hypothetical protein